MGHAQQSEIRLARALTLVILLWAFAVAAYALDPALGKEMPSPERVEAQIRGIDELDTKARLEAAFYHLREIVAALGGVKCHYVHDCPPEDARIIQSYDVARGRIEGWIKKQPAAQQRKWFLGGKGSTHYEFDMGFRNQVIQTFFSPPVRALIQRGVDAEKEEIARNKQNASNWRAAYQEAHTNETPISAGTLSDGGLIALVVWGFITALIVILGAPRSSIQRRDDVSGRVVFAVTPSPASFTFMVVTAVGFLALTIFVGVICALIGAIVVGLLRGPYHPSAGKFAAYGAILGVVIGLGVLARYCWVKFFRTVFRSERCRKPVTLTVDDRGLSKDGRLYPMSDPAGLRMQSAESLGRAAQWSGDTVIVVGTGLAAATTQMQLALARLANKFGDWARKRQESRSYMVTLQTKESNQIAVLAGGLSPSCASSLKRDLAAALAKVEQPGATNASSGNGVEARLEAKVSPAGTSFARRLRVCGLVLVGQAIGLILAIPVLPLLFPSPNLLLVWSLPIATTLLFLLTIACPEILCSWLLARSCAARIRPLTVSLGSFLVAASILLAGVWVIRQPGGIPQLGSTPYELASGSVGVSLWPLASMVGTFLGTFIAPRRRADVLGHSS